MIRQKIRKDIEAYRKKIKVAKEEKDNKALTEYLIRASECIRILNAI